MTKEDFEKEAGKWADDMVWALVDMKRKANDDERDFLAQEYKDLQERFTKEVQVKIDNRLKRHCNTIHSLVDELERRQNVEKELQEENKDTQQSCENYYNKMRSYKNKVTDLEKENTALKAQIEKMKCCQNCMHYRHFTKDITECAMSFITAQNCRHNGFDKWEIKENG